MTEVYATTERAATASSPRYRGLTYAKPIDAVKEAVPILDLAERLAGPGVRRGRETFFRCPLHDDHDPSLRVDPGKGVWFCDPCLRGGDVVELARLAWGYDQRDAHIAASMLLLEFGHEVPQRPPSWFVRQERQRSARDRVDAERIEHVRMLLFRLLWTPWLKRLPEWVREEAAESAWNDTLPLARQLYEQRRDA
jgi:hypothetical protein